MLVQLLQHIRVLEEKEGVPKRCCKAGYIDGLNEFSECNNCKSKSGVGQVDCYSCRCNNNNCNVSIALEF